MIYSCIIFILLIMRNYFEKKELFLIESMIVQIFVVLMFKINMGAYGLIAGIIFIGLRVRKLQLGNTDGDRRY